MVRAAREAGVARIDVWDLSDGVENHWQEGQMARLLDENFDRRPQYEAMLRALYDTLEGNCSPCKGLGYALTDCPLFTEENGDSAFTMITDTMPRPYGPVADNLEQRAEWTDEFFRNAFARPDFVGWHYCGLIDASNLIARKRDRQHSGLLDDYGEPYPQLKTVLEACTDEMYEIATRRL